MARYDLLKATNTLACKLTKWDKQCDARLRRLVAYVWSTLDKRLICYVGKGSADHGVHLFTDAGVGGCADSQRSTTGVFMCVRGDSTMFPLVAISKNTNLCVRINARG